MSEITYPPNDHIPLEDIQWQDVSCDEPPGTRLLSTIQIGTMNMHLEAWRVEVQDGVQIAPGNEERYDCLYEAVGAARHFTTIEIDGRDYILVATPYC